MKKRTLADDYQISASRIVEIYGKIQNKGAFLPCHRCSGVNFQVPNRIYKIPMVPLEGSGNLIPEPGELAVLIICRNCGAMTPHSLSYLDIDISSLIEGDHE